MKKVKECFNVYMSLVSSTFNEMTKLQPKEFTDESEINGSCSPKVFYTLDKNTGNTRIYGSG